MDNGRKLKILQSRRGALLFLAVFSISLWAASLTIRTENLGRLPHLVDGTWKNLSLYSMTAARNWHIHGFFGLKGLLVIELLSIENETSLETLTIYSSYSSAYLMPAHLIQLVTGRPVRLSELQWLGIAGHGILVLLVAWLAFLLAYPAGMRSALAIGAIAAIQAAFNYRALAYFTSCWWPDTAVLPALAAFYLALFLHLEAPAHRWPRRLLAIAVFAGTLLDWSFPLHFAVACAMLLWREGFSWKQALLLRGVWAWMLAPFALALLLFIAQLFLFGSPANLAYSFLKRTAQESESLSLLPLLKHVVFGVDLNWLEHLQIALAVALTLLTLLKDLSEPGRKPSTLSIVLVPAVLGGAFHVVIVREHYVEHIYEWTKLALPFGLAAAAFSLAPLRRYLAFILPPLFLLAALAAKENIWRFRNFHASGAVYARQDTDLAARFIGENTRYEDVVFTPGRRSLPAEMDKLDAEQMEWARSLAFTHKVTWLAKSPEAARELATRMLGPEKLKRARIRFFVDAGDVPEWKFRLKGLPFVSSALGDRLYTIETGR